MLLKFKLNSIGDKMKRFAATMIGMTGRTWTKKDALGNMRVINTTAGMVAAKQPKKVMHTSAAFAIQRIMMAVRFIVYTAQRWRSA